VKTEEQVREMLWENRALLQMFRNESGKADGQEERDIQLVCGTLAIVLEEGKTVIPEFPEPVKCLAKRMRADFENQQQKTKSGSQPSPMA